jgi:hypothetical protein
MTSKYAFSRQLGPEATMAAECSGQAGVQAVEIAVDRTGDLELLLEEQWRALGETRLAAIHARLEAKPQRLAGRDTRRPALVDVGVG